MKLARPRLVLTGDQPEQWLPFAWRKLAHTRIWCALSGVRTAGRVYQPDAGVRILVRVVEQGSDLLHIDGSASIGWAQKTDGTHASLGWLAGSCDHLVRIFTTDTTSFSPWGTRSSSYEDCDSGLFYGALNGMSPGVISAAGFKNGWTFTYGVVSPGAVGAPTLFTRDGATMVTATPCGSVYDVHYHAPTATHNADGTLNVQGNTQYVGTAPTSPFVDRALTQAVWAETHVVGMSGEITGTIPAGALTSTTVQASSLAIPGGALAAAPVAVSAAYEQYPGTDSQGHPLDYPAYSAQTEASTRSVQPSNDTRPWWVYSLMRPVSYWSNQVAGIPPAQVQNLAIANSGLYPVMFRRDVLMRGTNTVYAPTDETYAHIIAPTNWGSNPKAGTASFIYTKLPLVQDTMQWADPSQRVAVSLNGNVVFLQDTTKPNQYELLIVEGTAITYRVTIPDANASTSIHDNGQAILVGQGATTSVLERSGATWESKAVTYPATINATAPFLPDSSTQYEYTSDGGFQIYRLGLPSTAKGLTVYRTKIAKDADGAWTYTEKRAGVAPLTTGPGTAGLTAFRAFRAWRPYMV